MNRESDLLPSWRPGVARDALTGFLEELADVPVAERLACFDNDGTLWCERPRYVQLDFFLDALRRRAREEPGLGAVPEYAALLEGDRAALSELGLPRIALALTGLFQGRTPEAFTAAVRAFLDDAEHPTLGRRHRDAVYLPMLELVAELRRREVTVAVVTGGGAEFVRAVSQDLYGVPPELVVGTLVEHEVLDDERGMPSLRRTADLRGGANEGAAKILAVQAQLGRRPVLAAGNSAGDRRLLEWVASRTGPSLSVLVDHDDAEREVAYAGTAETFEDPEPIAEVAARLGWCLVSMREDWEAVLGPRSTERGAGHDGTNQARGRG